MKRKFLLKNYYKTKLNKKIGGSAEIDQKKLQALNEVLQIRKITSIIKVDDEELEKLFSILPVSVEMKKDVELRDDIINQMNLITFSTGKITQQKQYIHLPFTLQILKLISQKIDSHYNKTTLVNLNENINKKIENLKMKLAYNKIDRLTKDNFAKIQEAELQQLISIQSTSKPIVLSKQKYQPYYFPDEFTPTQKKYYYQQVNQSWKKFLKNQHKNLEQKYYKLPNLVAGTVLAHISPEASAKLQVDRSIIKILKDSILEFNILYMDYLHQKYFLINLLNLSLYRPKYRVYKYLSYGMISYYLKIVTTILDKIKAADLHILERQQTNKFDLIPQTALQLDTSRTKITIDLTQLDLELVEKIKIESKVENWNLVDNSIKISSVYFITLDTVQITCTRTSRHDATRISSQYTITQF